jgi:di/tricarboxylate transporter
MGAHAWEALLVLAAATALLVTRRVPLAVTALAIPVALHATGVVSAEVALQGFGNHAVIAIGAMMIVGMGLRESGVATLAARGLLRVGGRGETRLLVLLSLATACLSVFMNNPPVVAVLLPVGVALSRRAHLSPTRLLLPLAIAAVLGGTVSLVGSTPNFLAADHFNAALAAGRRGYEGSPIGIFDFAPVGVPVVVVGVIFLALVGRRLLPLEGIGDPIRRAMLPEQVARTHALAQKLFVMRLAPGSGLVGRTIATSGIRPRHGLNVLIVERPHPLGHRWLAPDPALTLQGEDLLYCEGSDTGAWGLAEEEECQMGLADPALVDRVLGRGATLAEVTPTPRSTALGHTLRGLDFRKQTGLNVLLRLRRGASTAEGVASEPIELGDTFLVSGATRSVRALTRDPDWLVLTETAEVENLTRAPLAIALLVAAILPPIAWGFPLAMSALGAALAMALTRCVTRSGLGRAVDWPVLCLVAGTLPLGAALDEQGIAAVVGDGLVSAARALGGSEVAVFGLLFALAAAVSMLTSNAAAAVVVAPVAAHAAIAQGVDVRAATLAMAYGCSCNLLVPYAQCNLLVMAPGGYRYRDFLRVGGLASLVMAATTMVALALR